MLTKYISFLLLCTSLCFSQQKIIQGLVTDIDQTPISNVQIKIKNTNLSYFTNEKGNYEIPISKDSIIIFKHISYITKEVVVGNQKTINLQLELKQEDLEQVLITAVGIKREKKSLGIATTTINNSVLNNGSQNTIAKAIQGKLAGVSVQTSSTAPGTSSGIMLRGINTLQGSNQPLIVVDGVPITNFSVFSNNADNSFDFGRGIDDINPNDIASLTIIKGSSESVLYGARGANGVVNITTKKGSKKGLAVDFYSTVTISNLLKSPNYQSVFGQGYAGFEGPNENVSFGPELTGEILPWGNFVDGVQQTKSFSAQENQVKDFYETGIETANTIAVSGRNDTGFVRLSLSNVNTDGINPGSYDKNERTNLNMSFTQEVGSFSFGSNLTYVDTDGTYIGGGQGLSVINGLLQIPVDIDVDDLSDLDNPYNSPSNYFTPYGVTNPYFSLENSGNAMQEKRIYGSVYLDYKINDSFILKYRYGLDNTNQNISTFASKIILGVDSPNYGEIYRDGYYGEASVDSYLKNQDLLLNYTKKINPIFSVDANLGFNINELKTTVRSVSVSSQNLAGLYSLSNSSFTPQVGINSILGSSFFNSGGFNDGLTEQKLYGLYGTATFNYNNEFYVTTNFRNDWTSTLPAKNRSVLYGGVNTAWLFTKSLSSLKPVLNYGKLRVGYGETGVAPEAYNTSNTFHTAQINNQNLSTFNFPTNGVSAYEVGNRAENPNLKAERRKEIEIGTELYFLKNRIGLDVTYYHALVENQILTLPLAASTGSTYQVANVGTIENNGVEFLLHVNWIQKNQNFKWNSNFNYSTSDSRLKTLNQNIDQVLLAQVNGTTSLLAREGERIGLIEGSVPLLSPDGKVVVDGYGVPLASSEKEVYGNMQYDYSFGFTNNFSYKNLGLSFTLDGKQGGLMFSRTADITRFTGNSITTLENNREPFIFPNSVKVVEVNGVSTYVDNDIELNNDSTFLEYYDAEAFNRKEVIDKSFVKLREVVLSYDFKNIKLSKKTTLDNLSLSVIGRNLKLWTPEENQFIDPESSSFGTDIRGQFGEYSLTPNTKSISFSVSANF